MRGSKETQTLICQLEETNLKVLRLIRTKNNSQRLAGFALEQIPPGADDSAVAGLISQACKKVGHTAGKLILSLPRQNATCRYLKIPTQSHQEIEKIVFLQAPKYLPYQADELITGYQLIENDADGFAQIEAIIANKEGIERYLSIFKALKTVTQSIVLSSYGIAKLLTLKYPQESAPVIVIDMDLQQAEILILRSGKVLYSRKVKVPATLPNGESRFFTEIDKTREAYSKETAKEPPVRIIVTGCQNNASMIKDSLSKHSGLPVDIFDYTSMIESQGELNAQFAAAQGSFASLLGLGIASIEDSLNLNPSWAKADAKTVSLRKETIKIVSSLLGGSLILSLAFAAHLENKKTLLKRLTSEIAKISSVASGLEAIDKRLQLLHDRSKNRLSGLVILEGISKALPEPITLSSLIYEENTQVLIHGQAPQLKYVLDFVSSLEKIQAFASLGVKIRYATQKKNSAGEFIDFEIACSKTK